MRLRAFLEEFIHGNTTFVVYQQDGRDYIQLVPATTYRDFDYIIYQQHLEREVWGLINKDTSAISILVEWK